MSVSVDVLCPLAGGVTGLGEKLAVTLEGTPEALRVTGDWKSLRELTVMVTVPEPPLGMVMEVGLAEREKSGAGLTVSTMLVEWVRLPLVPVMVMVNVPVVAVELAVRDSVEVPGGATGLGAKEAVTPDGRPVADRVTGLEKPPTEDSVMVTVPALPPRYIVREVGLAEMVKSGLGLIVREMLTLCVRVPSVPVMVRVKVPVAAVELAARVRVELAEPLAGGVTGFTLKDAVTPVGRPETLRLTGWL